ncbi:hypothetical protein MMC27_005744 [Xylographa pallens]|nr:hypothetical protein [Xylographa pallens]
MLPLFEGCGDIEGGVGIIAVIREVVEMGGDGIIAVIREVVEMGGVGINAVIRDVVELGGVADEVSDSTLEESDMGTIPGIEKVGLEVLLRYWMDTWTVEESGCLSDEENARLELKSEVEIGAATDNKEDVGIEAAATDTIVEDDTRKVKGGVGGPTPPRMGGKGKVLLLVCVTIAVTDVFAVGSKTPELAHSENEAK